MIQQLSFVCGCRWSLLGVLAGASLLVSGRADAQEPSPPKAPDAATDVGLGIAPGSPQVGTLPGGIAPAYGARSADEQDYRFDYHGVLSMPLRVGLNTRRGSVTTEQKKSVIHAPPTVPDYLDSFNYTGVVPQPYAQLSFSYGNSVVTGTAAIVARTASTAASFFEPPLQSGITDAFVSFNLPNLAKSAQIEINVGAFSNAYGAMGEYDLGRYGTPLLNRTNGVGENIVARFAFGDWVLDVEQGVQTQFDKAPVGIVSDGANGFADPNAGTGLVHHEHLGIGYRRQLTLGLHYMQAWSQDDRAAQALAPDGTITTLGADLRFSASHLGHLYIGAAYTDAEKSLSVGRIVELLNTEGGAGLRRNYLGPGSDGTGQLLTLGAQYDLSLAHLLLHPRTFDGKSHDLILSLFGILTNVSSQDKSKHVGSGESLYDGVHMLKLGGEGAYTLTSWLALAGRVDHVRPTSANAERSFSILSPRVIFRSDWQSRDQVVLQYSHFLYGADPLVRSGYPLVDDPSIENPDESMLSLSASMWW